MVSQVGDICQQGSLSSTLPATIWQINLMSHNTGLRNTCFPSTIWFFNKPTQSYSYLDKGTLDYIMHHHRLAIFVYLIVICNNILFFCNLFSASQNFVKFLYDCCTIYFCTDQIRYRPNSAFGLLTKNYPT